MLTQYPDSFFIVHHRFTGDPFKDGGEWGDIGDGPVADDEAVINLILDAWKDEQHEPDCTDFRVWQIVGNKVEDCTAWAIRTMIETLEEGLEQ
jgi:hypothetical protein